MASTRSSSPRASRRHTSWREKRAGRNRNLSVSAARGQAASRAAGRLRQVANKLPNLQGTVVLREPGAGGHVEQVAHRGPFERGATEGGQVPQLTVVRESLFMTGRRSVGSVSSVASVARCRLAGENRHPHEYAQTRRHGGCHDGTQLDPSRAIQDRAFGLQNGCLLYTSPSPRDGLLS